MRLFTNLWNLSSGSEYSRSNHSSSVALRILTFFIRRCSIDHTHPLGFPFPDALGWKCQFQLTFHLRSVFETWLHRSRAHLLRLAVPTTNRSKWGKRERKARLNAVGVFLCWPKFIEFCTTSPMFLNHPPIAPERLARFKAEHSTLSETLAGYRPEKAYSDKAPTCLAVELFSVAHIF